jgi:NADPH:quinone reductase-like Zn-dependent oxidoreductase
MKAIVYTQNGLPIDDPKALVEMELAIPEAGPHDVVVEVRAVSVNPVDTKIRLGVAVTEPRVLGWDASGVVQSVGDSVTLFAPGDEVFYAGSLVRPGSNSQFQAVDERIVGKKPRTLGFAEAAALPLTPGNCCLTACACPKAAGPASRCWSSARPAVLARS